MSDVRDDVPLNAVQAALEAVDSGRVQIALDNLRILEIHLRALSARAAVPEGWVILRHPESRAAIKVKAPNGDEWTVFASSERYGRALYGLADAMLAAAPQPAGEVVAKSDNVIDKLLATVPMPCLPTAITQSADRILAAVSNPSAYGGKQGVFSTIRSEVKMLLIAADRVRDAIKPEPAPSAPADVEALADGERFAFLVSRWHNNDGTTTRPPNPADEAILNALITGDMPAIRLVIDNVRRLSGAQQAAKDGAE